MVSFQQAQAITQTLFSLQEPWRERFLTVVARMARGYHADEEMVPNREQVVEWLAQDARLCQDVACMLRSWPGCADLSVN